MNQFDDQKCKKIQLDITEHINQCNDIKDLNLAKSHFVGKDGIITTILRQCMKDPDINGEDKKIVGKKINDLKDFFSNLYKEKINEMQNLAQSAEQVDFTIPVYSNIGKMHPLSLAKEQIHKIMQEMGFCHEKGPSIESEYYNFEALNIEKNHPARNEKDTFFVEENVLRTHTTSVQIRALESGKYKDNFRIYSIGDVYRRDDDSTHLPMFHQIEGFIVDDNASVSTLKGFLLDFLKKFFEKDDVEIQLRPGYFPFTEPSVEVDVKFDNGKWLEILGAGMIRKNILQKNGYKKGFAFGIGLERIAMIKFGISEIHDLVDNNLPWLKKYGSKGIAL
ncbi:phenylalanine--tRNA ligase subunit alpha [Candidatus Cytomitobacter indipagum]|uniref:phenylalanine--tRNA ligase n=1 Tax=Candidatus Cytomitobacter indipagum TaxID=2601575 RepID=A0A5C0UD66_9PROT|nr:phenylalanine--tRNA ligase subunit alpha [Candidatus Cytomitobacter indipagum]QEK37976.1 phenylalanine--tRNA ligase subunit alpha [Candidatus Cytomitobacter indipagum]